MWNIIITPKYISLPFHCPFQNYTNPSSHTKFLSLCTFEIVTQNINIPS